MIIFLILTIILLLGYYFWSKKPNKLQPTIDYLKNRSIIVHLVKEVEDCEKIILRLNQEKIVGFDTEWDKNQDVALIQVATQSMCFLFQIPTELPVSFCDFLTNRDILKVGVGITNDVRQIYKTYGIMMSGCLDISYPARELLNEKENFGLKKLAKILLDENINESKHPIVHSDWSANNLSNNQVSYAAADAVFGLDIWFKLKELYNNQISFSDVGFS